MFSFFKSPFFIRTLPARFLKFEILKEGEIEPRTSPGIARKTRMPESHNRVFRHSVETK